METTPYNTVRITAYPLEERAGAGRCEVSLSLADPSVLDALPPHVRARVLVVLADPKPGFDVLRDGAVYPPYAVVTQVESPGTVDQSEFAKFRVDLATTFDSTRKPMTIGW